MWTKQIWRKIWIFSLFVHFALAKHSYIPSPHRKIMCTSSSSSSLIRLYFWKNVNSATFFCKCLTTAAQVAAYQHQVQKKTKWKVKYSKEIFNKIFANIDNFLSADCCSTDQTNKCKNAKEALLQSWQQLGIKYVNSTSSSFKRDLIFTNCIYLMLE